jgi:hypothetical protein
VNADGQGHFDVSGARRAGDQDEGWSGTQYAHTILPPAREQGMEVFIDIPPIQDSQMYFG